MILLYIDPVLWNQDNQITSDVMKIYTENSKLQKAEFVGRPVMSSEIDTMTYNQVTGKLITAYFRDNKIYRNDVDGNVQTIYYMTDDKDSSLIGLNYLETDTMRMYMGPGRKMEKIWTNKFTSTMYPMTQIPPAKYKLNNFAWFEDLRPKDKNDIFVWRGKSKGSELKNIKRHEAPLQKLTD